MSGAKATSPTPTAFTPPSRQDAPEHHPLALSVSLGFPESGGEEWVGVGVGGLASQPGLDFRLDAGLARVAIGRRALGNSVRNP